LLYEAIYNPDTEKLFSLFLRLIFDEQDVFILCLLA